MTLVSAKEEYDEEAGEDEDPAASGAESTTSLSIAGTRGVCSRASSLSVSDSLSFLAVLSLGIWGRGEFLSSGVRRARRLLDARRRLIGGHGPCIGFAFGLGT